MNFQSLKAEVIASSIYAGGEQIGMNTAVTLPAITPETITVNAAGGKLELPMWQQLAAMTATITKTGLDPAYLQAITPNPFDLIINIAQKTVDSDGGSDSEHVKAYLRVIPKSAPALELTPGAQSESKITFSVLSYQLTVDGKTYLNIDIPKGKCVINGTDYMSKVRSIL